MQPGVYFDLPEADYFDADALGSSDLKMLARSPADWWWYSKHNPLRPSESASEGRRFGKALHKRLLEGRAPFEAAYYIALKPPPGTLKTTEELKEVLARHKVPFKSTTLKDGLIKLVRTVEPSAVMFNEWVEQSALANAGKEEISDAWFDAIQLMGGVVSSHPQLSAAFVDGAPEVSIFWERDGINYRARIDYKKPRGAFDLKSIANWRGNDFRQACLKEIAFRQYDAQAAHYMEAIEAAFALIDAGQVFGKPQAEAKALFEPEYEFVFVFMQTIGSPRAIPIMFPRGNAVHERGKQINAQGAMNYAAFVSRFTLSSMWVEVDELWQPSIDDWAQAAFWR